jgi:hypothetical protein
MFPGALPFGPRNGTGQFSSFPREQVRIALEMPRRWAVRTQSLEGDFVAWVTDRIALVKAVEVAIA